MNPTYPSNLRRIARPAAAGPVAAVILGALLGASAHAQMYRPPSNLPGGVPAAATITSYSQTSSNATFCWYGMQGLYQVEASTNAVLGPWAPAGGVAVASDFAWCQTVPNPDPTNAYFFRLNQSNYYGSANSCGGCHSSKYSEWSFTAHATALNTLANVHQDSNPACLPCHTVGYGQPTGYTSRAATPHLTDVGCENCHGPAGWHIYSDKTLIRPAASIDPAICGGCHTGSHHPTYDEYETALHSEVNDDVKYGVSNGTYYTNLYVTPSNTWYGYYVTTNADLTLKTNATTGIIYSLYGPANHPLYDQGQDRAASCGICHSAAARMAMLADYEARQTGITNPLVMPCAQDSASWSAACATCHDPHADVYTAQLRNPTRSTNYFTMATTTDKRTNYNSFGVATGVSFMNTTFASMYDPKIQICGQCHNTRGARWDGRSFGLITNLGPQLTNIAYVNIYTNIYTTNRYGIQTNSYVIGRTMTNVVVTATNITVGLTTNVSFSRGPHHSVQYNVLVGIVQPDYLTTNSSGVATNYIARHGVGVSGSGGNYNTNQCATCHVPSYAVNANTNYTGHTFELSTYNCTLSGCHGSVPRYEDTQVTTITKINNIAALLNQWAITYGTNLFGAANATKYKQNGWEFTTPGLLSSITNAGPSAGDQLKIPDVIKQARFNSYIVLNDGSLGVHNPGYLTFMLTDAETKVLNQFTLANFKAFTTAGYTPLSVGFTNYGVGVTNYSWNFGDGKTSTLANPTNIYTAPGSYVVTLTAAGPSGTQTLYRTNYINVAAKPVVSFTATPRTGATPLTVTFSNTSSNTNSVTLWRWSINGQSIYSQDTVYTFTNVYSTNLTYNISLRATTAGGTITTTSNAFITVTP